MYELTEGKVEYGKANSIVKNMFYLSKSRQNAIRLSNLLSELFGNDSEFKDIIEYIRINGFRIEPEIILRKSGEGVKISESVNVDLQKEEQGLVDEIRNLQSEELEAVLQNGGLYNARDIITRTFSIAQQNEKIDIDRYYVEAIFSTYNWQEIGIEEFKVDEKVNFLQRMQNEYVIDLYKKLENRGIERKDIPTILLNMITRKRDFEVTEEDTLESIKEKRLQQYDKMLEEQFTNLTEELSIEKVERFLGYYDVQNTGIQLRPYQLRAVERTDEIFENNRFASVILPTGAGKSFIALDQLMKHQNESMLYLAPQNEILEQIKDYIIENIHGPINTVGRSKDAIVADVFPNLKFATYPGLLKKGEVPLIKQKYDFIVLDELHRTGADKWGKKLDKLLKNQAQETKVLGITATPRRDVDGMNMAKEIAEKLGYTNEDAVSGKHIAMNMSLINAIRMGLVVNPRLVYCKYDLISSGKMQELEATIEEISDVDKREDARKRYNELNSRLNAEIDSEIGREAREKFEEDARKNIDSGLGKEIVLKQNVKKGGKYIVFLPIIDQIEDEDGNKIGRKKGKSKIAEYEKQIQEWFKGTNIAPRFHSMLGEYGDKENERRLEEFQNSSSDTTEFMLVMNKANEGLHIGKIDGIIWLRPIDKDSRILYLQQLGRAIYSEDPDNPTKEEDRPVVIDLVNNTLNVNWDNEITEKEDKEILRIIIEWIQLHDGFLPNINSTDKEEKGYANILKVIQEKYKEYSQNNFEDLNEEQIEEVKEILRLGAMIDLWQIVLPEKELRGPNCNEREYKKGNTGLFEITGVVRDFIEMSNDFSDIEAMGAVEKFIRNLEKLQEIGVDVSKITDKDTIERLARRSGVILTKEEWRKFGLEPHDNIGIKKSNIAQSYRGKGTCKRPTEQQVQELLKMGISLELNENIVDIFIRKMVKLQQIGIDVSKIQNGDTVETLAEKSGVVLTEEKWKKIGLIPNDKIGIKKDKIAAAYRGTNKGKKPTNEQIQTLLEMGISLELKDNPVDNFINEMKRLQGIGVDVSKITRGDTIEKLAGKSGVVLTEEEWKRIGLMPKEKIGRKKFNIAGGYRGTGANNPPTEEQVKKLLEIGISLELKPKADKCDIFINKLKVLQKTGVDVSKITKSDTIERLAEKSGIILTEEEWKKLGLEPGDKIAVTKVGYALAYRGRKNGYKCPTKEQVKKLLEMGISLEKQQKSEKEIESISIDTKKDANNDKLSKAKQKRDEAKSKNDEAKELERQVEEQLKKRGKDYEEQ